MLDFQDERTYEDGKLFHGKKGKTLAYTLSDIPLADTHGHLSAFDKRMASDAIARAACAGVRLLGVPIDPVSDAFLGKDIDNTFVNWIDQAKTSLQDLQDAHCEMATLTSAPEELFPRIFYLIGVHPYGAAKVSSQTYQLIENLCQSPLCRGIGEIGLDETCDIDLAVQEEVFIRQLHIAQKYHLPCELHIRDAKDDASCHAHARACEILRKEGIASAGTILHCYTGCIQGVQPYLDLGCTIAFGGAATFKRSDDIRDDFCQCPLDRIVSETDCPYMAPVPVRGQEAEPAFVSFTVDCLAEQRLQKLDTDPTKTRTAFYKNACEIFNL